MGAEYNPRRVEPSQFLSTTLLGRVRERDPAAWGRFVHLYTPLVCRWCRLEGVKAGAEDDIVQEVFVSVDQGIGDVSAADRKAFRAWLRAVTRHRILDHFRRARVRVEGAGGTAAAMALDEVAAREDDAAEVAALYRRAMALIAQELDERSLAIFRATVQEARPMDEVAAELGMSVGALYQARYRMFRRLRDELEGLL